MWVKYLANRLVQCLRTSIILFNDKRRLEPAFGFTGRNTTAMGNNQGRKSIVKLKQRLLILRATYR